MKNTSVATTAAVTPIVATQTQPRKRGFAAMDPEKQRLIASMGGRSAHESGNAHEFTSEEARAAGRLRHAKK